MPKITQDELIIKLEAGLESIRKGEYDTEADLDFILRTKFDLNTEDPVSDDGIQQLYAAFDELKKTIAADKEAAKDVKVDVETDEEEEALKFKGLGDFLGSSRDGQMFNKVSPVLEAHRKTTGYLEEGIGSQGGDTVPEDFLPQLLMNEIETPIVRPIAWSIPTNRKSISIPRVVDTSHASSVYGGIVGTWTGEAADLDEKNPTFGQLNLSAKKLTLLTYCSNELLADNAVALEAVLGRIFPAALRFFEDKGFIKGSGVNEPLGLSNSGCIKNINTTASHFYVEDAAAMYAAMMPAARTRAVWIMSNTIIPELLTMETLGNSGNMWFKGLLSIKDGPEPWTLLGRPIYFTEHCAALGTTVDAMFVDAASYIVLNRQDVVMEASPHVKFTSDQTTWRLKLRTDGECWQNSVLTLEDGATEVSPVVNSHHA